MNGRGAPTGRAGAVAVWDGREVIIWGGGTDFTQLNDGAKYDPQADAWTPISSATAPSAGRYAPMAVWSGREMIIWGGVVLWHFEASGGRYDPVTDSWTAMTPPTDQRTQSVAASPKSVVWTGDRLIVWGGTFGSPWNQPPAEATQDMVSYFPRCPLVRVSWPAGDVAWSLESAADIGRPVSQFHWSPVSEVVRSDPTRRFVVLPAVDGERGFRLRK